MHKHDQGIDPTCRWCDLDQLLMKLSDEWGPSNLDSYLKAQMDRVWKMTYPVSDRRFNEAVRILVDNGIPLEQAREMLNREGWT